MISLVIPVFNEQESLPQLHTEITESAHRHAFECEIIFVDDGSRDGSWEIICQLAAQHSNVQGIRFRRNFGKAAALDAGFAVAQGEVVVTLDADLQDDPAEIPRFLQELQAGKDLVSGWKKIRHDPWHKVLPSRVFNAMVSMLTGVRLHDHNCGMKAYRAEVIRELHLYGEMHRFTPVLAAARGFRIGELIIHHRARKFGSSKYGFRRFLKGFFDLLTVRLLTRYGERPQHAFGSLGLLAFLAGNLGFVALTLWRTWEIANWPLVDLLLANYSLAGILLGPLFVGLGWVAEIVVSKRESRGYNVVERTK